MKECLWKLIDGASQSLPSCWKPGDRWYFAREYVPRGGYGASDGNQRIINFKKGPEKRATREWQYRTRAVINFAHELAVFLPLNVTVVFVPTSKSADDPQFDDRFVEVGRLLSKKRADLEVVEALRCTQSHTSFHGQGGWRTPEQVLENLEWVGGIREGADVYVIDDMVTSGSHFRACETLILEGVDDVTVSGAFWTLRVDPPVSPEELGFDIDF